MITLFNKASDLIASGYLEAYVLGALSPEEERLVQAWLFDGEVRSALAALEDDLVKFASAQAVPPPDHLRAKLNIGPAS